MDQLPNSSVPSGDPVRLVGVVLLSGVIGIALIVALMLPVGDSATREWLWVGLALVAVGVAWWALWLRRVIRRRTERGEGLAGVLFSYWMCLCGYLAGVAAYRLHDVLPGMPLIAFIAGPCMIIMAWATQFPTPARRRVQVVACHVALACSAVLCPPVAGGSGSEARAYTLAHYPLTVGLLIVWAACVAVVLWCVAPGSWWTKRKPQEAPTL